MEFRSKYNRLWGTSYVEVRPQAAAVYKDLVKQTKRQPYVRSKYFNGDKVFVSNMWVHMLKKNLNDRARRLVFLPAALDLIRNCRLKPDAILITMRGQTILYRFYGNTKDGYEFGVQVKKNVKTGRKDLMSIFPTNKSK